MQGKEGDSSIDYEKMYRAYYMEVYSYVMTIIKNADQAEEITQETFYRAIKNKSSFQGKSNEYTQLCSIAKNFCTDILRKKDRTQELNEDIPAADNIAKAMEDEQMMLLIHQILHSLEEPYKEVFNMRIFGELSFSNIGIIFGKSENWARVTYHRARLKIQSQLEVMQR